MRDVQGVTNRLAQFQIDSINVVTRAHFMPLYSRLGPYDPALLERAAHQSTASPLRVLGPCGQPDRHLSAAAASVPYAAGFRDVWSGVERVAQQNADLIPFIRNEVAARGPISARDLEIAEQRDRSNWGWNWSRVKTVLEWLFYVGELTSAYRNSQFERVYDLPERVIPNSVLALPTPSPQESVTGLIRHAARALGIAEESSLRDYFRTRRDMTRLAITTLVEDGELIPVAIKESGNGPWYLWHEARAPRRITARALLSPFDSMIFERARLERLFDFTYRIEIYVPAPKRVHGYYVYPFLLGQDFVPE
jgi:uncharacterized protein YcaQ